MISDLLVQNISLASRNYGSLDYWRITDFHYQFGHCCFQTSRSCCDHFELHVSLATWFDAGSAHFGAVASLYLGGSPWPAPILSGGLQSAHIDLGIAFEVEFSWFGRRRFLVAFPGVFACTSISICGDFAESEYRDLKGSYCAFQHLGTFDPFLSELAVETASAYSGHWFSGHSFHFEFTSSAPGPPTRDLIASMCCISEFCNRQCVWGCPSLLSWLYVAPRAQGFIVLDWDSSAPIESRQSPIFRVGDLSILDLLFRIPGSSAQHLKAILWDHWLCQKLSEAQAGHLANQRRYQASNLPRWGPTFLVHTHFVAYRWSMSSLVVDLAESKNRNPPSQTVLAINSKT